jgi:hypothetical protein
MHFAAVVFKNFDYSPVMTKENALCQCGRIVFDGAKIRDAKKATELIRWLN